MKNLFIAAAICGAASLFAQKGRVGINTTNPQATFQVVANASDTTAMDGIMFPTLTGDQLGQKTYTSAQTSTVVYATAPSSSRLSQVLNVDSSGLYFFDGNQWQKLKYTPTEYFVLITFDPESTQPLTEITPWTVPVNYSGNTNNFLTARKTYKIGSKNFGGINGNVQFRKLEGAVKIFFQIYRTTKSAPIDGDAFIQVASAMSDIGIVPHQIVLLHTENSTQFFPALLENFSIQIPKTSLNAMSTSYYTYGEAVGWSNMIRPLP